MQTFSKLSLLFSLATASLIAHAAAAEDNLPRREFTGKAAEELLKILVRFELEAIPQLELPIVGYNFEQLHCTVAPSPQLSPDCQLTQKSQVYSLAEFGTKFYSNFVQNGADIKFTQGLTEMKLFDISCIRYEIYRGVSKCFYRQ